MKDRIITAAILTVAAFLVWCMVTMVRCMNDSDEWYNATKRLGFIEYMDADAEATDLEWFWRRLTLRDPYRLYYGDKAKEIIQEIKDNRARRNP